MNRDASKNETPAFGIARSSRIFSGFLAMTLVVSGLIGAPAAYAGDDYSSDNPSIGAIVEEPSESPTPEEHPDVLESATPKIVGTAKFGQTLTADPGEWTSGTEFTYQWYRNGTAISGATGTTYRLSAGDTGATITVGVTGAKDGYKSISTTSASTSKIAAATLKTATPKILGTARFGQTLSVKPGTWTSNTKFGYQWYRNGKAISGAKSTKYKLTPADAGKQITVKVTGTKAGYTTASKSSAKTAKVATLSLKKGSPKVSGNAKVGKKLTVKRGTWTSGTSFKYQWYRDGKIISKATKASYTLKAADTGKRISVKVKGSKPGYTTASKSLAKTSKVAKGTLKSGKPSITGTVKVGKTVTAKTGTWSSGTKLTYQWYRSGKAISGAKSAKYKVKTADNGKRLTVKVTGTKAGYNKVTKTSGGSNVKKMTTGEKNAVKSAKLYLKYSGWSKSNLVFALKEDGYTGAQSKFAVEYIAPNWNKEAIQAAKDELEWLPSSRSMLIEDLRGLGFTATQAKYGADHSGANWKKNASKYAKLLIADEPYSRKGLFDTLRIIGFTKSEAEYGLKTVGY